MKKTIVLAYSGGLDTTVSLKWLQEKYDSDVITVTLDIGQREDLDKIEASSKEAGGLKHYNIDAQEEFIEEYIFPSIQSNGLYEGKYPLGTALGRPLIAKKLVEIAEKESSFAVAHGCTGKGNDQIRLDVTIKSLNDDLKVIVPVRDWNLTREQEIEYAKSHNISFPSKSEFSIDQNLWGRSIEAGRLEDPTFEPPEDIFEWVNPIKNTPDDPTTIEIGFKNGVPISLDGKRMRKIELINQINAVAGLHGIGIIDHIESRLVGIKSREIYEAPAAIAIIEAHRDLEKLVLTRHQLLFKTLVETQWSWLVYSGLWVDPLRRDLESFISSSQILVEGWVKLKLFKGNLKVIGRDSPFSIYRTNLATYSKASTFDQKAAEGFSDLWGLQSRIANQRNLDITKRND